NVQSQGDGSYTFTNLSAGTYYVREIPQSNWVQTQPTAVGQVVVTDNVAAILQTGVNQIAYHQFKLKTNGNGTPAATSAPQGLTPTQIRKAYGFDQISFGAIQGDGRGQTIAIIDAYDAPTIANDL